MFSKLYLFVALLSASFSSAIFCSSNMKNKKNLTKIKIGKGLKVVLSKDADNPF
jgi:hypothetical protein